MIRTSRGVPCDGENYFEWSDNYTAWDWYSSRWSEHSDRWGTRSCFSRPPRNTLTTCGIQHNLRCTNRSCSVCGRIYRWRGKFRRAAVYLCLSLKWNWTFYVTFVSDLPFFRCFSDCRISIRVFHSCKWCTPFSFFVCSPLHYLGIVLPINGSPDLSPCVTSVWVLNLPVYEDGRSRGGKVTSSGHRWKKTGRCTW
jgi:hypothetical protein